MYGQPPRMVYTSSQASSIPTSSGSNGSSRQPSRIPGDVPTAVRNLLLSTKQLQEVLQQWSVGGASESQVSNVYVKTGTDFNAAMHAFAHHKIDLSDIYSVPHELRAVLEQCLSEEPSPRVLDMHMPTVRRIIYKLLQGLQTRQDAWKAISGGRSMPAIHLDYR